MSLRLKLLLPLLVACLAALAYLEFAWAPQWLASQKRAYLDEVERHLATVSAGLVPLMLTHQLDVIHGNLGELRRNNADWTSIVLTDAQGRQLFPPLFGAPERATAGASIEVLEKDVRFLDRSLGRLVVQLDFSARLELIRQQLRQLALLLGGIIAVLALVWAGAIEFAVLRPVRKLARAATALAHQRFDVALPSAGGDEIGALVGSFAAMRDDLKAYHEELLREIGERKNAERETSALNTTLERRVAERTAALQAAFKELESFSYSVSHDLRAPLRAINGYSHILLDSETDQLSEEGRHMLDRIAENVARLGQLIDDILEYSRSSRLEMRSAEVDLAALARKVAAELAEAYPRAAIDIGPLPVVVGDRTMLGQVMQNLIGNALKFSAKREAARIEIGSVDVDGETAFFVRDNGAGFDMRYADKLFGMFQRMHGEREFAGTGVGLAIVKRLIERHGGHLWAEAEPDKGATFYFTLGTAAS